VLRDLQRPRQDSNL